MQSKFIHGGSDDLHKLDKYRHSGQWQFPPIRIMNRNILQTLVGSIRWHVLVTVHAERDPDDDLHVEVAAQVVLDLTAAQVRVVIGVQQALLRRQQRA